MSEGVNEDTDSNLGRSDPAAVAISRAVTQSACFNGLSSSDPRKGRRFFWNYQKTWGPPPPG